MILRGRWSLACSPACSRRDELMEAIAPATKPARIELAACISNCMFLFDVDTVSISELGAGIRSSFNVHAWFSSRSRSDEP